MARYSNGTFYVVESHDPTGYRPGTYYFVVHAATGNKVSRRLRRPGSAFRKAAMYAEWYAAGDHYWPEVDRCDELRSNPDAVPTWREQLAELFNLGCNA